MVIGIVLYKSYIYAFVERKSERERIPIRGRVCFVFALDSRFIEESTDLIGPLVSTCVHD